jgi:dihydrofolate synthase/folylpolyglutamate synthase
VTYAAFLKNLNARGMFRIRPDLTRIRKVLALLGNPQDQIPAIHIAGTNGKGSVAAALESVLRASGYRTGLYTSPHLIDLRERIKINGSPMVQGFTSIAQDIFQTEKRAHLSLTYFELLTAIAFQSFRVQGVDISIVECGLGGQWDATNVLAHPLLSIITSIGLDHTEWLGKNELKIAAQKAGIIKPGTFVISGVRGKPGEVITRTAIKCGVKIDRIDLNFRGEPSNGSQKAFKQGICFLYKGEPAVNIPFSLSGAYQIDNAAVVMSAVRFLKFKGWRITDQNRNKGLSSIDWPGRYQLISRYRSAPILLDGAHNPPAIENLLKSIESSRFAKSPKIFVFSAFKDKDIKTIGRLISSRAAEICLCSLPGPRGARMQLLRSAFKNVDGPVRNFKTPKVALANALNDTPREGLVVVTGSLALVGAILESLKNAVPAKTESVYA